jgi:YVTN family beta-propeller protein
MRCVNRLTGSIKTKKVWRVTKTQRTTADPPRTKQPFFKDGSLKQAASVLPLGRSSHFTRKVPMLYRIASFVLLFCAFALSSAAQSVVADIAVSGIPYGVAVNPDNNRVYIPMTTSTGYAVAVIDGKTNTVADTVTLSTGAFLDAVNLANGRVYIAGCTYSFPPVTCGVSVLDGATDKVIATIPINAANGIGLQGIAVNPVTNRIYVSDASNLVIDVIDGNSNTIIASISLGGQQTLGLAFDYGTNELLAAINGNQIAIIAGWNNSVHRVKLGTYNANAAVNPLTSRAYFTNETFAPSTLGVVDVRTGQVLANIPVGNNPFAVCVDLYSNLVFVTDKGDQTVAVVDGKTNTKVASVSVSGNFIDVNPVTRLVYTSDLSSDVVHVISE